MKLISVDEASQFSIDKIHDLYEEFVNKSRVDLLSVFGFGNETVDYAEGLYIYTTNGKKIYDFTGGIGVLSHGHNHPRILKARIKYEQERRMEVHKNYFSPYIAALCHNLAKLLPGDLNYSFFPNSGAEAVDAAMRAAYKYHDMRRTHILFSNISFHGKLLGPSSVTMSPENDYPYPRIPNTHPFEFDDINSIKNYVKDLRLSNGESQIAAIICEPFSVSNMRHSSELFLRELRKICDEENIVLIFDEVYTGWCKTGDYFYFMRYPDLVPDILCMAKSFGGGKASISGVIMSKKLYQSTFDSPSSANLLMSTFYGFGEETITAIEAVNIMVEDDYPGRAKKIEAYMTSRLDDLTKKHPRQIEGWGGCGAIYGLFLNCGPEILSKLVQLIPSDMFRDKLFLKKLVTASVVSALYEKYNILSFTSFAENTHLIISPPLITSEEEMDYLFNSLNGVFEYGLIRCITDFAKRKFFR
jgi:putrescine aminotransferase